MATWIHLVNIFIFIAQVSTIEQFPFFLSDTELNHLRINEGTGEVYIGAVNRLYQLYGNLSLHFNVSTGPRLDHKKCTPPIDFSQCPSAAQTDNYNKLLVLDVPKGRIIVCGSIFKGICSLRKLNNITELMFYDDSRGEKSFVASNDEKVETVGLVSDMSEDGPRVLFVGKGTSQHDNGIIISTRILDEMDDKGPFETYVDSATFKYGYSSASTQEFVTVFEDSQHVYFISSLLDKNNSRNRTFITRLCKSDYNYFSYVEMDLVCKDENIPYNICTSAYLAIPGENLAHAMGISDINDKVLFGVFSTFDNNQEKSALCMFSLENISKKFEENRELCYTSDSEPLNDNGESIFSKPFGDKIGCGGKQYPTPNESIKYPCGSEHLPYPLQSRNGVVANAVLTRANNPYTSVAVSVEKEHTIAFLGTAEGKLIKAFLHDPPREYRVVPFDTKSTVKNGMVFDAAKEHVYVMTKKKVHRVPVQDCSRYSDCSECTQAKDPYCGWCVIDGKCTIKKDCDRASEPYHWLWSPDVVCLKIESAYPSNMSVKHLSNIVLSFAPSIKLHEDDQLKCNYGENNKTAILGEDGSISCPQPDSIPTTVNGYDYVNVTIKLFLTKNDVFIADYIYKFYNCEESMNLSENLPCISCVNAKWECQWDIKNHKCIDTPPSDELTTINKEEDCPQFYEPNPSFIPMELKRTITFYGKNLEKLESKSFIAGNDKLVFRARVVEEENSFSISIPELPAQDEESTSLKIYIKLNNQKIDSSLNVNLYNCFYGRSDCSLCRAADTKYECVWCNNKCVYKDMCNIFSATECPNPSITDFTPKAAPLNGGILLTIMGSNLGITPEDVEEIKVAGVNCTFRREHYSVSTRVICEVGPAHYAQSGHINMLVNKKEGISPSSLTFTYQEPEPTSVRPDKGVLAGGTIITIFGNNLETGSKNDVQVSLDGFPCTVVSFGEEIICITSQAKKEGTVKVRLSYGTNTVKEAGKFTYRSNPTITQFNPDRSFASGGRKISISGIGFDLVQNFSMIALLQSRREKRELDDNTFQVIEKQGILEKVNDTVIIFSSPQVPENYLNSEVIVVIKMDGFVTPLQTTELSFNYVSDPTFDNFTDGIKKQVNNLINAKGSKLNEAMTIEEAKAFVGEGICKINTLTATDLYCVPPEEQPPPRRRHKRDTTDNLPEFTVQFGNREWILGKVEYGQSPAIPLHIIIPVVLIPMILIIITAVYFYRRKSQQAEREYEKVKQQLEGLEESVRDRCKKEFTDLMIEMEDQTNYLSETGIPFLDYKMYTDRVFFWPSKDGEKDVMITGKLDIPEARRQTVEQSLNQFSNLLNSKSFLTIFIHTLENQKDFSAREKLYFASLLTVALHGKLEYYTDIMRTLFVELMEQYVAKNPKLMLRRSETVVERMLSNWMSICLYQFLKDTAGEHLYKLFKAIKHQVEKGPVDAVQIKAKYTLNDTGLLGDDVEYTQLTVNVIVQDEGLEPVPVKVLNCDTITQVKEKIVEQVYKNLPYSHRPKADSLALEWRPGSTAQILSDLDLTSQKEGRWKRINTLMHYNVRDNATLILSRIGISQQHEENHQDFPGERHALLEDENKIWHLVRPADEVDEGKSKRGSMKGKEQTKAITEIYLTRLLSVKGTLQQFVDNFFHSVLNSNQVVPPAVKYFFDFLDEQAEKYEIKDEDTVHIWKTNSLSLRFWVNILKNPHFIFDVHVHQVVDASLSVIAQTFMDACSRTEHKLSRESPSNKLLYAKEISTYKKMVEDYYKGIRQMVQVSDQDMNTHLAEISRAHTESLNTVVALHQLYQYTKKYYDEIINALEEDPSAQRMQLAIRLQQIAAALENKVTDL
ncbi:plexin-B2 [Hyla sarda]|uniref:plexin-B2 n=1 Tax=Hyla sarda TaxID=327740 RepID=UPI0024C2A322|nr:plexin-B2 [Hyla sarda]XP_056429733.1 plexin-B2 [Hyla sarda]XP_056429734.1 plexin-B2 [Hyla sarda]XP_056429735.1 plexin-B2 [Hyla sarda]XP_056429736.1 plexin-B2 [Hyla sarda]XP_056429738.1 plexin-B2 [Hyla sarda]